MRIFQHSLRGLNNVMGTVMCSRNYPRSLSFYIPTQRSRSSVSFSHGQLFAGTSCASLRKCGGAIQPFHSTTRVQGSNFYDVLGVSKTADDKEIKRAYYKLAKRYHPDTNSGDSAAEQKFKEVSEAYEVLSDKERRQLYDQFGRAGIENNGSRDGNMGGMHPEDIFSQFENAFGGMFGGSGFGNFRGFSGNQGPAERGRGEDVQIRADLDWEDAMQGVSKDLQLALAKACSSCEGSGMAPGTGMKTCDVCHGSGSSSQRVNMMGRIGVVQMTCTNCGGTGSIIAHKCSKCNGNGLQVGQSKVTLDFPAGIDSGMNVRFPGHGHKGVLNGPPGDLYVRVHVLDHPCGAFVRDGQNVASKVHISFTQAALGGKIPIRTVLGENLNLTIPPGINSGTKQKLKGKGIPFPENNNRRGDHYIKFQIMTPQNLTSREEKLLRKLEEEAQYKVGETVESNSDSVKADRGWFQKLFGQSSEENENENSNSTFNR